MLAFILGAGTVIVLELVVIGLWGVVMFLRGARIAHRREEALTRLLLAQHPDVQPVARPTAVNRRTMN